MPAWRSSAAGAMVAEAAAWGDGRCARRVGGADADGAAGWEPATVGRGTPVDGAARGGASRWVSAVEESDGAEEGRRGRRREQVARDGDSTAAGLGTPVGRSGGRRRRRGGAVGGGEARPVAGSKDSIERLGWRRSAG